MSDTLALTSTDLTHRQKESIDMFRTKKKEEKLRNGENTFIKINFFVKDLVKVHFFSFFEFS